MTVPSVSTPRSPKKSNALLWIGCGVLPVLLIGGLVLGVFAFFRFAKSRHAESISGGPASGGAASARAELRHFRRSAEGEDPLPTGKCFFGALVNTGTVAIARTELKLTFYDAADRRVGAEGWTSTLSFLGPGEMEPISMCPLVGNQGTRHVEALDVQASRYGGAVVSLETADIFTKVSMYTPRAYAVRGSVRNNTSGALKKVEIVISLVDPGSAVVGGGVAYPAGGMGLAGGETARFETTVFGAIEKARVEVRAVGYDGW